MTWNDTVTYQQPAHDVAATAVDLSDAADAIELTRGLLAEPANTFMWQVAGPVIGGGLHQGDIVMLAATTDICDGDVVVARIALNDGRTLPAMGHFYPEGKYIRLAATHPGGPVAFYRPEQVAIEGKVLVVMRAAGV